MGPSPLHYFPLAAPFLLVFFFFLVLVVVFIEVGVLEYAYESIGIGRRYVFSLLLFSLLGSYVNIPVAQLPGEQIVSHREIFYYGMLYVIPSIQQLPRTIIAVNLGGAVVPTVVSLYLIVKHRAYFKAIVGTMIVTAIVHWLAEPVEGVGIAVPTFIPPLIAAATALLLSRRTAAILAYISGSLGTLIGADLMNLSKIQGLGTSVASIGGAGTFDGIFLTGIIAVLLASPWVKKAGRRKTDDESVDV
jgi:uncharacterized membrane protein